MTMNDGKNLSLAAFSSLYTFATAVETQTLMAILSAIALPVLFFVVGKTADIWLQIYLFRRKEATKNEDISSGSDR